MLSNTLYSQEVIKQDWSNFMGCEKHCGIIPTKEYSGFGTEKWKFKTKGKIFSSPAVLNGLAYIGSEDKNLYAINLEKGKPAWKFKTGGAVHSSPAVYGNKVYFSSYDETFMLSMQSREN